MFNAMSRFLTVIFRTGMEPLPRYLVYYKGKVYISDFGAAKIYVLNIANG